MHAASRLSFEGHKCEKKCYWSGQCDLERKLSSLPCHVCFLSLLCVKVVVVDRWQKVRVVCQPLDAFYSYFSERGIEFSTTRSRFYVSRRLFRLISRFVWVKWTHIIECEIFFYHWSVSWCFVSLIICCRTDWQTDRQIPGRLFMLPLWTNDLQPHWRSLAFVPFDRSYMLFY